jgi:hypothetical protein
MSKGVPRLDQMFESFDTDKDGKLSMAELGGMLQTRGPPTKLKDKKYFLVTSDDKYVVAPMPRKYKFAPTGGNISSEHLNTIAKPVFVRPISGTNNKYYIGMGISGNAVLNGLDIRSGKYNERDDHMVWFGNVGKPKVILPGNNNTFNIFMDEGDTVVPNVEIEHSNGDFKHDFMSQTMTINGQAKEIMLVSLETQRLKIPSPFVNSLLDGKWKFVLAS